MGDAIAAAYAEMLVAAVGGNQMEGGIVVTLLRSVYAVLIQGGNRSLCLGGGSMEGSCQAL
jgi:hypothetical protein